MLGGNAYSLQKQLKVSGHNYFLLSASFLFSGQITKEYLQLFIHENLVANHCH